MSTSQEQQHQGTQQVIECDHPECDQAGRPWTFQHGYCSTDHWYRDKGRKALAGLKYSHTRCFTCLSTLKEIEPPKDAFSNYAFQATGAGFTYNADEGRVDVVRYGQDETQRSACGFQYLTPDAAIGEKDAGRKIVTGTVCGECGVSDHRQHVTMLADGHRTAGLAVDYLTDEDDDEFDAEVLHREYAATGDLEQAVGAAIVACRD